MALQSQTPAPKGLDHELGVAYYKKGDYPNAVCSLQAAQKEEPNDGEVIQLTGLSLYLAGKPADAIPYLEKVQREYRRCLRANQKILRGTRCLRKNVWRAAGFGRRVSVRRSHAASSRFRTDRGGIRTESRVPRSKTSPCSPVTRRALSLPVENPRSCRATRAEVAVNPANPVALYKLADAYTRIQKFDEAEKLLQRSIWLDATSTVPMGKVLEKKGEALLAVRALQRAINMDPNNSISHHLLGQAYRDLGRSEDAERERKLAEQLQSRDAIRQP
jgi:Flp pilus assembly protein TadD